MKANKYVAGIFLVVLLLGLFTTPSIANTIKLFNIDEETSSINFEPLFALFVIGGGSEPIVEYPISGTFKLIIEEPSVRVELEPLNISTPILFNFPDYSAYFSDDTHFGGGGDPCQNWTLSGTCSSMGNFGYYSGIIDGEHILLTGSAPINLYSSYRFTINATTNNTPVPEPSTILMLGIGLSGFFLLRKKLK